MIKTKFSIINRRKGREITSNLFILLWYPFLIIVLLRGVTSPIEPRPSNVGIAGEITRAQQDVLEQRALVQRIAHSETFRKSSRLRELLLFLCESSVNRPDTPLREQELGVAVFGRSPDYDTTEDTLVRVQTSLLRKKLRHFFDGEGLLEPIEVNIPRGSYRLDFQIRRHPESVSENPPMDSQRGMEVNGVHRLLLFVVIVCGIAALLITLFFYSSYRKTDYIQSLWRDMFANGHPVTLVTSDASLALFQDTVRYQLSLREYRNKDFYRIAHELLSNPADQTMALIGVARTFNHAADTSLASMLTKIAATQHTPSEVVFARDLDISALQSSNVVLLGSRRANPWVELFENKLNFRTVVQEQPLEVYLENHLPLQGESRKYPVNWAWRGYCRVAFLPNLNRTGSVLLVSGTDMAATAAGGQFITSAQWLKLLRSKLALSNAAPFPYFEVLLKAEYIAVGKPQCDWIAVRRWRN